MMNSMTALLGMPTSRIEPWVDEQLSSIYPDLLSLLLQNSPLQATLNKLVQLVWQVRGPSTRTAIFIHEPASRALRFAASVGISTDYTSAVDGFPVEGGKPSCGNAAYYGRDEFVEDVRDDDKWQPYLHLCTEFNFRACWSFALMGSSAQCLGTLAFYHADPCLPAPEDVEQIRYFAKAATLLIERHLKQEQQDKNLRELEQIARTSTRSHASLSIVAHELRNPLSAIYSAVKVLQLGGHQAELRDKAVAILDRQARQMEWLVEGLIDTDRAVNNTLQLNQQPHNLYDILKFAVETVDAQFEKKQQRLIHEVRAGDELVVHADYRRLAQVFINLLGNSSKFSPTHSTVTISIAAEPQSVSVSIKDEGIGLAPVDVERIFQMFEQVESTQREGLGIGLALVKRLVELHGGMVSASSPGLGHGSIFNVTLPVAGRGKAEAQALPQVISPGTVT